MSDGISPKLTGPDIVGMVREAWTTKLDRLMELDLKQATKAHPNGQTVVGPGLRVKHKKSGLIYTVDAVGHRQFQLLTPDNEKFTVSAGEMNDSYELD